MLFNEFLRGITATSMINVLQRISHIYFENNKKPLPNLTYEPNETFMLLYYNIKRIISTHYTAFANDRGRFFFFFFGGGGG